MPCNHENMRLDTLTAQTHTSLTHSGNNRSNSNPVMTTTSRRSGITLRASIIAHLSSRSRCVASVVPNSA